MSNPIDLLLNPTHDKGTHSSLKIQWVREFLDTGFLKPQHFLDTVNDSPVWLEWVRKNCSMQEASALVVEQFNTLNFDWMSQTSSASPLRCIESIFPYCNAETLDQILAQLPSSALSALQSSVFENKTPNLSLLSAAHHFENADSKKIVEVLLKWGWNIEELNEQGETLLLQTPYWNDAHILLECGANVLAVDHNNTTVFDRVRTWAHRARAGSAEITKTLNTYMRNAAPALNPEDQKKKAAITTMFSQIAQEKTGDLKKTLAVLHKTQAASNELVDVAGRSLVQVLREQIFTHSLQAYDQSHTRFFSRLFVILMDNHEPGGLIDLDQPFAGHTQWSDRDVLNMMLSTLAANRNFKDGFLTSQMRQDLKTWQSQRFPSLVGSLQDFFQPALDNEQEVYVRELLIENTTERPVTSVFFNCVSHHLNALPFEHPIVQLVVDRLRVEHTKHNKGEIFDASNYDNISVLPEDLLWAARYCDTHNLDNAHPLVHMVDVQMMAMWSQWNIAHRGEVGDVYSYRSLQHADRTMFKRFVVERSHQIDQMDRDLFNIWHAAQLKHHGVSSLYEIDNSRMDPSTLDLIARIQACVLYEHVQQHIGEQPLEHKSTRKI